MVNFTDLASVPSDRPVPRADPLRLAVLPTWPASRAHPANTPSPACAAFCSGAQSAALTSWPRGARTWSCISGGMQEVRRFKPSTVSRRFPVVAGSTGPALSTACWSTHPPSMSAGPRSLLNHRPWVSPTCSSRPCSLRPGSPSIPATSPSWPCSGCSACGSSRPPAPDIADLGEENGHRVLRVCGKGTKVVLVTLPPAVSRAIDRAVGERQSGPILLNTRGVRMDRHAATRRLRRLA